MYHSFKIFASDLHQKILTLLEKEGESSFFWLPVLYGLGVSFYFSFSKEPTLKQTFLPLSLAIVFYGYSVLKKSFLSRKIFLGVVLVALGIVGGKIRTETLATPLMHKGSLLTTIRGEIKTLERFPTYTRVTFHNITLDPSPQGLDVPLRSVRISFRGKLQPAFSLLPGDKVETKAVLQPPAPPISPGAYNFRRKAYFEGIGAVGYGVAPLVFSTLEDQKFSLLQKLAREITRNRAKLTNHIRLSLPGQGGAVMASLVTGDRSGITETVRTAFADAGLAHILAISGLHLSIVAGFVFLLFRGILSLAPFWALKYNTKKGAALLAIGFTFFYLLMSGNTVPAQRAFIMTFLILLGILKDRFALTMRNVSLAAFVILSLMPESLVSPSFQLSFAAVIALVSVYGSFYPWMIQSYAYQNTRLQRLVLYVIGVGVSSLIATLATAPFTIFTFNRFSLMALGANILAIPYVTFIVMPLILLGLLTAPFSQPLWEPFIGSSLRLLINFALHMQHYPGASILIPQIPLGAQILCVVGMLWIALWKTSLRLWGVIPLASSIFWAGLSPRPSIFIPYDQDMVGFLESDNSTAKVTTLQRGRFARKTWMQLMAISSLEKVSPTLLVSSTVTRPTQIYDFTKGEITLRIQQTKREVGKKKKRYTITVEQRLSGKSPRVLLEPQEFRKKGGCFIWVHKNKVSVKTVQETVGYRPWR